MKAPEPTVVRWAEQVRPPARVLDVAAGSGRHALLFAERGLDVTAVDRDAAALRTLAHPRITVVECDLEQGVWPLAGQTFDAVVVVNYLWRTTLPDLLANVAPGGLLLYETFGVGHERFGRPQNPDFLLRDGELREAVRGAFDVLEFAHGEVGTPPCAVRQRLLARRTGGPTTP